MNETNPAQSKRKLTLNRETLKALDSNDHLRAGAGAGLKGNEKLMTIWTCTDLCTEESRCC